VTEGAAGAPAGHGLPAQPKARTPLWNRDVVEDIWTKATLGRYRIQGGATRLRVPCFDDLTFVPATMTRVALEGYRERCETRTVLGSRCASKPIVLDRPITIAGMSYGALSKTAKTALGTAATRLGISTTTGDGGMLLEERAASHILVYQVLPSRYGFDPAHLKAADAIEVVMGQGAKPGTGGLLLGAKVSPVIAEQRTLPAGVDQRSPVRHPDFIGPDDLQIKIEELREATNWEKPIYVKMGASRVSDDVKLAVKAGADVIVLDGLEGATGASPEILLDHTAVPTMGALVEAVRALEELRVIGEVQLVISGGIKHGADAAKALALGADAVSIGTAALVAMGADAPLYTEEFHALGYEPGDSSIWHTGMDPTGIATQEPELEARLDLEQAADRVFNFINAMTLELQILARACGKADVHDLEPEDMRALTFEASMITGIPLAGTDFVFTPDAIAERVAAILTKGGLTGQADR
jgi:glutamate synthase domain-containing protein 2